MFTLEKNEVFEEHFMGNSSRDLFNSAWRTLLQYRNATDIDNSNAIDWLESIISEKVNNPRSRFYIQDRRIPS
jgi:hypothetical protein